MASANLDPYPALLRDQFTALAQLRAIEVGRWLVSTANTGPSLVIDAQGVVRAALPAGRAELGLFELEWLKRATTYQIWREAPLILMILLGGRAGGSGFSDVATAILTERIRSVLPVQRGS